MDIIRELFTEAQLKMIEEHQEVFETFVLDTRESTFTEHYYFTETDDEILTKNQLREAFNRFLMTLPEDMKMTFTGAITAEADFEMTQSRRQRNAFERLRVWLDGRESRLKQYLRLKKEFGNAEDRILGC